MLLAFTHLKPFVLFRVDTALFEKYVVLLNDVKKLRFVSPPRDALPLRYHVSARLSVDVFTENYLKLLRLLLVTPRENTNTNPYFCLNRPARARRETFLKLALTRTDDM